MQAEYIVHIEHRRTRHRIRRSRDEATNTSGNSSRPIYRGIPEAAKCAGAGQEQQRRPLFRRVHHDADAVDLELPAETSPLSTSLSHSGPRRAAAAVGLARSGGETSHSPRAISDQDTSPPLSRRAACCRDGSWMLTGGTESAAPTRRSGWRPSQRCRPAMNSESVCALEAERAVQLIAADGGGPSVARSRRNPEAPGTAAWCAGRPRRRTADVRQTSCSARSWLSASDRSGPPAAADPAALVTEVG